MSVRLRRYCLIVIAVVGLAGHSHSQDIYQKYNIYRNPAMVFLNKFSITLTTGYSNTNYSHDFSGVYFFQDAASQFVFSNEIENLGSTFQGFTDWLNNPQIGFETPLENPFDVPFDYLQNPVNNPLLSNRQFLVNTDTTAFGFEGAATGIPIQLNIHYNIQEFRVGAGYAIEKQFVRELQPTAFADIVRPYQPNFKSTTYKRLYGVVGYRFYQFWSYDFVAELMVGKISAGKQFNKAAINRGLFTNIGVSIENNWSEYFRVIVRPSFEFKNYTVNLPDGSSINHKHPSFMIQFGLSINIPDIPRSPMASDHVQLKHVYTDPVTGRLMEVRGQPIWKRQNPKVGENHRRLWRYKWRNRKKLNPY